MGVVLAAVLGLVLVVSPPSAPMAGAAPLGRSSSHASTVQAADPIDPGWQFNCQGSFQQTEKSGGSGPLAGQRILQVGDSLTANAAQQELASLEATGASYLFDAMPGSSPVAGASAFSCINWEKTFPRLVEQFQPTIVIAEFCCNYWIAQDVNGVPVKPGSDQFLDLWGGVLQAYNSDATAAGAQIYWVISPPSSQFGPGGLIDQTNETVLRLVDAGLVPASHLIRWDMALTGGTGFYTATLNGQPVRQDDGLHLASPYGTQLAADETSRTVVNGQQAATPWGPFRSPGRLGEQAARDLLGLDPPTPWAGWMFASVLQPGEPAAQFLTAWMQRFSSLAKAGTLQNMYEALLGRAPDAGGMRFFLQHLATSTATEAAPPLFASAEYQQRMSALASQSDAQFVQGVYDAVLGRGADPGGLAYWTGLLHDGMARVWVQLAIGISPEAVARAAASAPAWTAYPLLLARAPTPGEVGSAAAAGLPNTVAAIVASPAYLARVHP